MAANGEEIFVGFGFGAIQAGLFVYEASRTGRFGRLVVAEVVPEVVRAVREARGYYSVNIAHEDHVETACVGPVEAYDPAVEADRDRLVEAIAEATELATAVPSVNLYDTDGPGSIHRLLAAGLSRKAEQGGPFAIVYTAENDNRAAEMLAEHVFSARDAGRREAVRDRVQFLNTVIGKMSGVIDDPEPHGLVPATSAGHRAFLVEAFNRILISRIDSGKAGTSKKGLTPFLQKDDLLPFEEAKLYGHNAVHAVAAYVGRLAGVKRMADLREAPGLMAFLRAAFVEESGAALQRKYAGVDPLFTQAGFAEYADDLLKRMMNPYLLDTTDRVGRDPARKLGWEDRLVGTIRLALGQDVEPARFGIGAAAGLAAMDEGFLRKDRPAADWTADLWGEVKAKDAAAVNQRIETGREFLRAWIEAGCPSISDFRSRLPSPFQGEG